MNVLTCFRFLSKRLLLVGDPKQLPPVVPDVPVSYAGTTASLSPSEVTLFARLQHNGFNPILLNTQYRCHPKIANICSELFYKGSLSNGVTVEDRKPILKFSKQPLGPVTLINVANGRQDSGTGKSLVNIQEALACVEIVSHELKKQSLEPNSIGVVCFYKAQAAMISQKLTQELTDVNGDVDPEALPLISTVDAFQGGERDVIIVCTTRTKIVANAFSENSSLSRNDQDFFSNPHRINVAFSRAKYHLIILCCVPLIQEMMKMSAVCGQKSVDQSNVESWENIWLKILEFSERDGSAFNNMKQFCGYVGL